MISETCKNWWMYLVRGLAFIIFGVVAFIKPTGFWEVLVVLFGVLAILDGLFSIGTSFDLKKNFSHWWVMLVGGVLGIVVGVLILISPDKASLVVYYLIAAWAIINGILEIVAGVRLQSLTAGEWNLVFAGALSILLGVLLIVYPTPGVKVLMYALGVYAIVYGIMQVSFSHRLHGWWNSIKSGEFPNPAQ
ncbi:MAG TPA: DUF308 domain-containing protein [Anaerolineaceae bacterium]|nr:DUF308 domain-containing protein [Anaerolineaceae bacterium]